jgi:hypothetical protein
MRELFRVIEMLFFPIELVITWLNTFFETQQAAHLK